MFVNKLPRYEILSPDAVETLERGWKRIVSELGVEFLLPEAVELFAKAGMRTEGDNVWLDPDFILEQVAKAPRNFEVQARNPAHNVHIGDDSMVFSSVYGSAVRAPGRRAPRRDDRRLPQLRPKLAHSFPELDMTGGTIVEPNDTPLDSRHLDMVLALQTLSDKAYMGSVTSGPNAADTIRMTEILLGGREAIEKTPGVVSLINVNSPLRFDDRMLAAMFEYNRARQPVIVTPFLLMGAMSPVSIPATLAQQLAEALTGIALTQLINPGCPVILGSFLSNTDMQSGSPALGTPESAIGLLCTGQMARRYGLPWRSGGGLTSSQTCDAQAAYEAMMVMTPTFLAGTNYVMHSAGWLEAGLVVLLREVHRRHRDPAHAAGAVHAARDRRGEPGLRRSRGGRRRRPLPRRRAHARALPRVLLPPAALLDRELPALGAPGRPRRHRASRRDLQEDARGIRRAARWTPPSAASSTST